MANTLKFGNGQWATGNGTALAYNDENSNFKPLPFDFTRASSGTTVNQSGLIETVGSGIPRIDFQGNTKGALLLEPSRSNIFDYSSNLSAWNKLNSTVTESSVLSLDGVNNSYVYERTSSSSSYIYRTVSLSNTTVYTLSFFAKSGTSTNVRTDIWDTVQSTQCSIQVDLKTKAISNFNGTSYKIEDYTNGWMRISVTFTSESSFGATFNRYFNADSVGSQLYIWGAQVEEGSYATSYIPTSGSAVTRVAESCSQILPNAVPTSGTIYAEIELFDSVLNTLSTNIRFGLNFENSASNWLFFGIESGDNLRTYIRANSSNSFDNTLNGVFTTAGVYKIAMRFATNDSKVFVNGIQKSSSTGSVIASNLNNLNIGGGNNNNPILNSIKTKDFKLYNTALTDAELQALTS